MGRIERYCDSPPWPGAPGRHGWTPRELADFAAELPGALHRDGQFTPAPVVTARLDRSLEDEPSRRVALADIEHQFARREALWLPAGEPLSRFDLGSAQDREHLRAPRI